MSKKKQRIVFLISLCMVLLVITTATSAAPNKVKLVAGSNSEWYIYQDSRFDFTIDYPADWFLIPRDDSDLTSKSGVVIFSSAEPEFSTVDEEQDPHETSKPFIVIGHYLAEFKGNETLSNWKDAYALVTEQAIPAMAYEQYEKDPQIIGGKDALFTIGKSDLLEFQVVNVVNGEIVWFVWTNMGESTNEADKAIFEQVANSIKFGKNTPLSLYDIYGKEFTPQALTLSNPLTSNPGLATKVTVNLPNPSGWIVPIGTGQSYSVLCGSGLHLDDALHKYSKYALDIQMYLKSVKSVQSNSWIGFAGWADGGWGNYVRAVYSDIYDSHYAHLNSIAVSYGQWVNKGATIGVSGTSGITPSRYHLHFHVSSLGQSVNLTGMTGFTPNGNYPNGNTTCGQVSR